MQPEFTEAQRKRKSDTIRGTLVSSAWMLFMGIMVLYLSRYTHGFVRAVLIIYSLAELGALIPIWILVKKRLKEIEGGEEDAAAQY